MSELDRSEIRRRVREVLAAELTPVAPADPRLVQPEPDCASGIITEADLERRLRDGLPLDFPDETRFTPLALETLDRIQRRRPAAPHRAEPGERSVGPAAPPPPPGRGPREVVALGADHGGFALKQTIAGHLVARGFQVTDCGTADTEACDYPVFARAVAAEVAAGRATAGIVVDGAGIGSAMVVNKRPGMRAAHCHNVVEARNAREHNHAQVLTLGSGIIGPTLALAIVDAFLSTPFGGGRHARRVALIETPTADATANPGAHP